MLPIVLVFAFPDITVAQQRTDLDPFFESKVRPILANRCWGCHSGEAGESKGSLRLDHGTLILQGGDSGPAVVEGKPEDSLLYQAVKYQGYEMPPDGRLPADEVETLRMWIERGAMWPDEPLPEDRADRASFDLISRRASHWAWQPRDTSSRSLLPGDEWSHDPIDSYIASRARDAGLEPSSPADRATLARRLYLDLLGIPPTSEEVARIIRDPRPDWDAALVDELLANPQFGVRWARHWMDLVRYAQSRGHEFDEDIPAGEAYRDYLVRALNADVAYNQFLLEHIAGDLLDSPRLNESHGFNESVLATGFWHFGDWVHSPVDTRKDETDRFDNMVDVATKAFLGVTVACARCHDHKFDAISTEDYYAMFGYLRSSHYRLVRYETDLEHRQAVDRLQQRRRAWSDDSLPILQAMARQWLQQSTEASWVSDHEKRLLDRGRQWSGAAQSRLALEDSRVILDARSPDLPLWTSDSIVYGNCSNRPLTLSFSFHGSPAKGTIHPFHEGSRDRFWDRMSQKIDGVNRQNRYAQIHEAGRILPTRAFPLRTGKVSYLVRGSFRAFASIDSHRLIAGPLHGETLLENSGPPDSYRWVTHSLDRYVGKTIHVEFSPIGDQDFAIAQVIDGLPPDISATVDPASDIAFARDAVSAWLDPEQTMTDRQHAWCAAVLHDLIDRPGDWLTHASLHIDPWNAKVEELRILEESLAATLPWNSKLAMAMRDGSGVNDAVLIRGNHLRPGDEVPRRNLEALAQSKESFQGMGSGRLDLAQQWIHPENPLVARVAVNRAWHHLLGRGLVATTDDLGVLGSPPTHPELLDHLAQEFIDNGWSMKSLIRSICLSHTYQQVSKSSPLAEQSDPDNKLLSHARVRRLEAEAVRDTLLSVTGELDLRWMADDELTVPAHLTEFLEGRGRPNRNGPLDGRGRRSLYLEVRRNFLHPFMTAFDMPNPFSTMGRRNVSNVPAQALILLNDPLVHALSQRWADRICAQYESDEERVRAMLRSTSMRDPTTVQTDQAIEFIRTGGFDNAKDAYRALAHLLLNRKELVFRF
jgi:hypothetical protein